MTLDPGTTATAVLTGTRPGPAIGPYRPWVDRADTGVAAVGLDRRIRYVNDAMCRLAGRTRAWLLGRPARDLVPAAERDLVEDSFAAVVQEPSGTLAVEEHVSRAGGDPVHVRSTLRLVRDLRDEPVLYVCEYVDLDGAATPAGADGAPPEDAAADAGAGSSASR